MSSNYSKKVKRVHITLAERKYAANLSHDHSFDTETNKQVNLILVFGSPSRAFRAWATAFRPGPIPLQRGKCAVDRLCPNPLAPSMNYNRTYDQHDEVVEY